MTIITIIGAGMMGSAISWPVADNHHEIRLVGTHLDEAIIESIKRSRIHPKHKREIPMGVKAYPYSQLAQAVDGADLVVCGVSSFGIDWFAENAGPYLKPEVPVLAITKGLFAKENGDLQILPDRLNELLPANKRGKISLNAVTGPCIAQELAVRRQTGVYFCGRDAKILNQLRALFATPYYHISVCMDFIGAEVCAAMKNAYAICINFPIGVYEKEGPDGIAHMYNPQAALFAQSMREIRHLVDLMGGQHQALVELGGSGDLYVTVFGGRNARLGKMLGQNYTYAAARENLAGETLEGVEIMTRVCRALPKLEARGLVKQTNFPLLNHLYQVIYEGIRLDIPWGSFFEDVLL
jgi:glycerol-3-phosphate dehydrogenase (NAD(P)+)